jgi:hypothetical protein
LILVQGEKLNFFILGQNESVFMKSIFTENAKKAVFRSEKKKTKDHGNG